MPCGNNDRNVIMARPMFRHQKESFSAFWFHKRTSVSPRTQ